MSSSSSPLLKQLLSESSLHSFTIVADDVSSRFFTPLMLRDRFKSASSVHGSHILSLLFDTPSPRFLKSIQPSPLSSKVHIFDAFATQIPSSELFEKLSQLISSAIAPESPASPSAQGATRKPLLAIIDSLSSAVVQYGLETTVRIVRHLLSTGFKVFAVVHHDTLPASHSAALLQLASAKIVIRALPTIQSVSSSSSQPSRNSSNNHSNLLMSAEAESALLAASSAVSSAAAALSASSGATGLAAILGGLPNFTCTCLAARSGSKIQRSEEMIRVDSATGDLMEVRLSDMLAASGSSAPKAAEKKLIPTADGDEAAEITQRLEKAVPFRLGLSDREKQQKDAVVLPHYAMRKFSSSDEGGGLMEFGDTEEYDADPDDDLEI